MGEKAFVSDTPIHCWFGLTYSNYLVLPRLVLDAMPLDWQNKFVALLAQMDDVMGCVDQGTSKFLVRLRAENGRFVDDPLAQYRHPDKHTLDTLRASVDRVFGEGASEHLVEIPGDRREEL